MTLYPGSESTGAQDFVGIGDGDLSVDFSVNAAELRKHRQVPR